MTGVSNETEQPTYSPEKFEQTAMELASNLIKLDKMGFSDLAHVLTASLVLKKDAIEPADNVAAEALISAVEQQRDREWPVLMSLEKWSGKKGPFRGVTDEIRLEAQEQMESLAKALEPLMEKLSS